MAFRFVALTNKEISQIIKQAVAEIHEEGGENLVKKVFVYKCKLSLSLSLLYLAYMFINKL